VPRKGTSLSGVWVCGSAIAASSIMRGLSIHCIGFYKPWHPPFSLSQSGYHALCLI